MHVHVLVEVCVEMTVQRYGREICDKREAGYCIPAASRRDWVDPNGNVLGKVVAVPLCIKMGFGECPDDQDQLDPESVL